LQAFAQVALVHEERPYSKANALKLERQSKIDMFSNASQSSLFSYLGMCFYCASERLLGIHLS
jgi:hypothetical protein